MQKGLAPKWVASPTVWVGPTVAADEVFAPPKEIAVVAIRAVATSVLTVRFILFSF
jgi:hypothetical protein